MYYILYASSAALPFSGSDLEALLAVSRRNNARVGVTGMLLYHEGSFIQYIEGQKTNVRSLFERISRDPRHRGIFELESGEIETRALPEWSMGYEPAGEHAGDLFGRFDLRRESLEAALDPRLPKTALAMMRTFYETATRFSDD